MFLQQKKKRERARLNRNYFNFMCNFLVKGNLTNNIPKQLWYAANLVFFVRNLEQYMPSGTQCNDELQEISSYWASHLRFDIEMFNVNFLLSSLQLHGIYFVNC